MTRYLPDTAGLFCLATYLTFLALLSHVFVADGDLYWHIKAGHVMLDRQALLQSDIFSHTALNTPWTAHEWLSEIIMASLDRLAGFESVLLFFILLMSLTFWLLFKHCEKIADDKAALLCVSLALLFCGTHMAARPHLFTWLFIVITMILLNRASRHLYWMPLIMLLWVNLHGGFILGLLMQVFSMIGKALDERFENNRPATSILRQLKHPGIVLLLSFLAVGINPFGYKLLLFPFQVTADLFSANISEWMPPDFQALWYFRYLLILMVGLLSFRKICMTWQERLLLLFFLNAALTHSRHISLFMIVIAPFLATLTQQGFHSLQQFRKPAAETTTLQTSTSTGPLIATGLTLLLFLGGTINQGVLAFLQPRTVFNVDAAQLEKLTTHLAAHPRAGKLFNDYILGGYLLYALDPPPKVFIDGRADMYGEEIFNDYKQIVFSVKKRERLLDAYGIDWIIFNKESGLVHDLLRSQQWTLQYEAAPYIILERQTNQAMPKEQLAP